MKSNMKVQLASVLLLALHANVIAVNVLQLQPGIEQTTTEKRDEPKPSMADKAGESLDKALAIHHKNVMGAVDKFRAEICADMKDEHGEKFATFTACKEFMERACKPGKDMDMDGEDQEVSSRKGYCKEYFNESEEKAEAEVSKKESDEEAAESAREEAALDAGMPGPSPGASPGPAPDAAGEAPAPAPPAKAAPAAAAPAATAPAPGPSGAPGPSPGPSGSPGPAPVAEKFIPGISKGMPPGKVAKDEKYYYKDNGKGGKLGMERLHMDENMKLPTQGYWGKLVEHEDMETVTGDWGTEFGPKSRQDTLNKVCKEHPDSHWCKNHFDNKNAWGKYLRNASPAAFSPEIFLYAAALLAAFAF